uniref:SH3 domain-containing protein n=1 Tax=Ascaris lumbricoides TaxID=6252 RepID=A0A0M3HVD4_ASCLU
MMALNKIISLYIPDFATVDPVYLALKQATGIYGRRGSSAHNFDSATPSPRNLSDASLQDSGYAEASYSRGPLVGSTPQLDQSGAGGRRRPPKLQKQMKSLSLDCAEPPPITNTIRSSESRGKLAPTPVRLNSSGDISDWERSRSPSGPSPRTTPRRISSSSGALAKNLIKGGCKGSKAAYGNAGHTITSRWPLISLLHSVLHGSHVVIHEYFAPPETALYLGDRLHVVDNGDPDWLHGFKSIERSDRLITFPSTCVAMIQPGEQTMILKQNVHIPESKMRLYRDQVVFAQPDTISEGRVLVRTERNAFVHCPLQYLILI